MPQPNRLWIDDGRVSASAVHLGVAISLHGGGLVAPAIHDAADLELDLDTLMANMRDPVSRAGSGRLRGLELTDGTITVSSLGDQGVESIIGIIYPPQVALVGFGAIVERPRGRRRSTRHTPRRHREPLGRPPGHRWRHGCPLPQGR